MDEPSADRYPGQDGGQRKDGQRQQAADLEQRERGEAAARKLTGFAAAPSPAKLPGIPTSAIRG